MKTLVLVSNHGNHTGFNRRWTIEAKCDSIEEGKMKLSEIAEKLAEKYDMNEEERAELYEGKLRSFEHDLIDYTIITQDDHDAMIWGENHYGYPSQEIIDYFES